jgi:MFS transporter, DHA2 family, metal-tetracycline-proton antiporter
MNQKENMLIITLCLIVLSGVANSLLFNVALFEMMNGLGVTASKISWVVISYTLVIACGSITYSKLASYFQIKSLLIFGISLFVTGSLIGYTTNDFIVVVLARIIQAAGGSSFIALSMILTNQYLTFPKRNLALTLIGACLSLGSGIGFLLGGFFTHFWGWHSLFLLMSMAIFTLLGIILFMPSGYANHKKLTLPFDFLGFLYLLTFVVTFILGVKLNGDLLIITVISVFFMGIHGKRQDVGIFMDLSVFRFYAFNRFLLLSFINSAAMVGIIFLFPLLAGQQFHVSALKTGFILAGISIFSFLLSFVIRPAITRIQGNGRLVVAVVLQFIGFLLLAIFGVNQFAVASVGVALISISFTILTIVINIDIPHTIKKEKSAMGLGIYNLINFLGMSFGPSIASRILNVTSSFSLSFGFFVSLLLVALLLSCVSFIPVSSRKIKQSRQL